MRSAPFTVAATVLALLAWPARGRAQQSVGDGLHALPAALRVPVAVTMQRGVGVAASGGYGYTESVLGQNDTHHRLAGVLAVSGRPLDWLALGLRLDGRYDWHRSDAGRDDGWVGDPRLLARVARRMGDALGLGLQAALWLPSQRAPSLSFDGASVELEGILSYVPVRGPVALTVTGGYRVDRSARSAPDAQRLSPADRLALGLNGFDAVLLGAGAVGHAGPVEIAVEWQWDVLVGRGSTSVFASPMHFRGGARWYPLAHRNLSLGALLDFSPSDRPDTSAGAPLVAIDPRVSAMGTVALRFPFASDDAPPPAPPPPRRPSRPPPVAAEPGAIEGRVTDPDGAAVADAQVQAHGPGGTVHDTGVDAEGRYALRDLPPGRYELTVRAPGRPESRRLVMVGSGRSAVGDLPMEPALPVGQVRGAVRGFSGEAVAASLRLEAQGRREEGARVEPIEREVASDGSFEIDVPPGRYALTISAPGFERQRRTLAVEQNGVTILNIDLRRAR